MSLSGRQKLVILTLIGAALAFRAVFFTISITHVQPSSDESIVMLQAKDITEGKRPLLFMAQPYLFPLESYLIAPFCRFLPASVLGARLLPVLIGLLSLGIAMLVMKRVSPAGLTWINVLLILFPSSYLLMLQSAYALPGYTSVQLLGGMSVLMTLWQRQEHHHPLWFTVATGFIAGLSFSSHPLLLPFVLISALYVCLGKNLRTSLQNSAAFFPGLLLGLIPYIVAIVYLPGAHSAVSVTYGLKEAVQRLWTPTLTNTLTTALGFRICLFPDQRVIGPSGIVLSLFACVWAAILLGLVAWRMRMFFLRRMQQKRNFLETHDLFIGIAVLTIVNFTLNRRADSSSYRYLLPFLWCFPFLMDSMLTASRGRIRNVIAGIILCLAVLNIATSTLLMRFWRSNDFPVKDAAIADLQPALAYLRKMNIRHCVASSGVAYRINFQSGNSILCAQPQNERFPNWPLPYKDQVDSATNVAYVLTDSVRFLKPDIFERHLRTMNVTCRKAQADEFFIYHDFIERVRYPVIPREQITLKASHSPEAVDRLKDGIRNNPWSSCAIQEAGMWIEITNHSPTAISGIRLFYDQWMDTRPLKLDLQARVDGEWKTLASLGDDLDKFWFNNHHPIYGKQLKTVCWETNAVHAIRVMITKPRPGSHWVIGEIEMLHPSGNGTGKAPPSVMPGGGGAPVPDR